MKDATASARRRSSDESTTANWSICRTISRSKNRSNSNRQQNSGTTMRTPGHDDELAAGFLVSEAIVRERQEISKIASGRRNIFTVDLRPGTKVKLNSAQRFGTISSSCGLCGKTSIEAIRQNFPAIKSANVRIDIDTLLSLPEKLRKAQSDFRKDRRNSRRGTFRNKRRIGNCSRGHRAPQCG